MREPAVIRAEMRRLKNELIALGREYAQALYGRQLIKGPTRWHGYELEKLRDEYENTPRTLSDLAHRHRTSAGNICNLAKLHDWKRRVLHLRLQPRSATRRLAAPVDVQAAE